MLVDVLVRVYVHFLAINHTGMTQKLNETSYIGSDAKIKSTAYRYMETR
jgi:hypothetical protein